MSANPISLSLDHVSKRFGSESRPVEVLREVSLAAQSGESLAIVGPSGSGKSTLLHLIGTLDQPSSGTIRIGEQDPFALPEPELARFRNRIVGFIFQDHHLLPQFNVLENVLIPTLAFKNAGDDVESRAEELLKRVGLSHRLDHLPAELSGGERQRVAIARALINKPGIMLCDEPTGNLDLTTAETVASLLFELHQEHRNLIIIVTHSPKLAERCQRRFELVEGTCFEA